MISYGYFMEGKDDQGKVQCFLLGKRKLQIKFSCILSFRIALVSWREEDSDSWGSPGYLEVHFQL